MRGKERSGGNRPALVVRSGHRVRAGYTFTADSAEEIVVVTGGSLTLRGCRVEGGVNRGVAVEDARIVMEDCVLSGNKMAFRAGPGAEFELRRCRIEGPGSVGLFLQDGARGVVEDCSIADFRDANALARRGASPVLERCVLTGPPKGAKDAYPSVVGVWVFRGATATLRDCRIEGFAVMGARWEGGGSASGCSFVDNAVGIWLEPGADPLITGCAVEGASGMGVYALAGARGRLVDCRIGPSALLAEGALTVIENEPRGSGGT